MGQENCITRKSSGKHFTLDQRSKLEGLLLGKVEVEEIAEIMEKNISTIYREINRGLVARIDYNDIETVVYRANVAERDYLSKVKNRERSLKIGKDKDLEGAIIKKIKEEKRSPDVALAEIKRSGKRYEGMICTKTLYNYIDKRIFVGITNANLWEKRKKKKKGYKKIERVRQKKLDARSIEERPAEINERKEYGHWEGDCVKGIRASKAGLFVLTERITREEIIIKIKNLTQKEIQRALDKIEKKFGKRFKEKFKSITFDNGSEFLDWKTLERSVFNEAEKRTTIYFAHSYSSWERGTNENLNRMIRRFIPKGTMIEKISEEKIKEIEKWINEYPRKILGYKSAKEKTIEIMGDSFLWN